VTMAPVVQPTDVATPAVVAHAIKQAQTQATVPGPGAAAADPVPAVTALSALSQTDPAVVGWGGIWGGVTQERHSDASAGTAEILQIRNTSAGANWWDAGCAFTLHASPALSAGQPAILRITWRGNQVGSTLPIQIAGKDVAESTAQVGDAVPVPQGWRTDAIPFTARKAIPAGMSVATLFFGGRTATVDVARITVVLP
jgi:hypothetical protein